MDIFAEAKRRVSMPEAARAYGFPPNRAGFIRCPFHPDLSPSLKLWQDHWHCFGCGAGGSAVDFAAGLFGLTPREAVGRLDRDFGLGLSPDRKETAEERQAAERRRQERETRRKFARWREGLLTELCAALYLGRQPLGCRPETWTAEEAEAVRWSAALEYWLEQLEAGDEESQMEIFRDRKGIEKRCGKILGTTLRKSKTA